MNTHSVESQTSREAMISAAYRVRWDYKALKSTDTGARLPGFEAQFYHVSNSVTDQVPNFFVLSSLSIKWG